MYCNGPEMNAPLVVYIGYDEREHDAYEVCRHSILRHSSLPVHIVRLDQGALRRNGWFTREWRFDRDGQRIDQGDGKPFSTDFSFTRFLVPALSLYQGWALFCDCDFLFTDDIAALFDEADPRYAVMCVKREHIPAERVKMDGVTQSPYRRKNWSSLVLWNCEHPANRRLATAAVNTYIGSWLHAFDWLSDTEIGALPEEWNWLSGVSPVGTAIPAGIHYTLGVPTMRGHEKTPYAGLWFAERNLVLARAAAAPAPVLHAAD